MSGGATPPGWAENPSSWGQRLPLVLWSLVGFGIAGYLSLFQWGIISDVWEPFFGGGSRTVLTSEISTLLPVPDAALGAAGYLLDAVTGAAGGTRRWKTMPWMVLLFGLAAGPLGLAGLFLVILQPAYCGAWCTLCLVSAVISVGLISPSLDEALASLQHLKREKDRGRSWWRAFWGKAPDEGEAAPIPLPRPTRRSNLFQPAALAAGVWLTAAPEALGTVGAGRLNAWILGPAAVSITVMSLWEFMRPLRRANVFLGLWVMGFASVFEASTAGRVSGVLCGLVIAAASGAPDLYRPALFGGGWGSLKRHKRTSGTSKWGTKVPPKKVTTEGGNDEDREDDWDGRIVR